VKTINCMPKVMSFCAHDMLFAMLQGRCLHCPSPSIACGHIAVATAMVALQMSNSDVLLHFSIHLGKPFSTGNNFRRWQAFCVRPGLHNGWQSPDPVT
jgi:hypothetical protein